MLVLSLPMHGLAAPMQVVGAFAGEAQGAAKPCCPRHADNPADSHEHGPKPDACCVNGCVPCCATAFPPFESTTGAIERPLAQLRFAPPASDFGPASLLASAIFHPPRA